MRWLSVGLLNLEYMHQNFNRDKQAVEIDGLRIPEADRCHVMLRQMDAKEQAIDKYIVLDMNSDSALQSLLKQVRLQRANVYWFYC